MFKWIIWNVDTAKPVGQPILDCMALEARPGEHHTVVPA